MASINAAGTNMENIGVTSEGADVPSFGHVLGAVNDSVVGFENENDMITECLVRNEKELKVISIVGMPGIGKTTLAMKLFKSCSVVHHFDRLAQGIVSQKFSKRGLILEILSQVKDLSSMEVVNQLDEEVLADMLCKSLKKHRYLILIDDVWDINVWHYLKCYLPDDRQGSRVLITTRNNGIALDIGSEVYILGPLSDDESWELFQKRLSIKENLSENLLNIAKNISEGCKGLPLSVVVIAGVLSNVERSEASWNRISRSVNLHILADPQFHCKKLLDTSFNNLPHHLQTCLLYLGRFPEDEEISVSQLTCLWLAEGLVQDTESKSFEDVANDYIMKLLLRNLIILSKQGSEGGVKTFRIHDLLLDFYIEKAREGKHISGVAELGNHSSGNRNNRLSSCNVGSVILLPDEFKMVKSQDTFFIGDSLSLLVGLRYLMIQRLFSNFSLNSMPSMSTLRNLQTLIIEGFVSSSDVVEVADFIWDLVKLRQLRVRNRASFELDILRIQNNPSFLLEDLISLSKPDVSHDDLKWLRRLPKLQKLSCIVSDTWDDCLHCHQLPEMDFLSQLTTLKMELWMQSKEDIRRYKFRLPLNLKKLTLILFVVNSEDISEIGKMLPSLQVLKLYQSGPWGSEEVERWSVTDEDFPKLKVLKLVGVRFNEWTISDDSFPCLEKLWLEKCFWLEAIPLEFRDIPTLRLISVTECKLSVDSSAKEIERVQKEEQNEQLEVYIYPKKWRTIFNMSSVRFRKWTRLGVIFHPIISGGLMFKSEEEEEMRKLISLAAKYAK